MAADLLAEPSVTLTLRVFLALMFATAAVSKLGHAEEFYGVVRNFRILPDGASRAVAMVLPVVELAVAAGLLIRSLAVPAAVTAAGLLMIFAVALAINVMRGRTAIDCGCFRNGLKQQVSWLMVLRNAALTAVALAVAILLPQTPAAGLAQTFVGIAAGSVAMLLYVSASMLGGLSAAQRSTGMSKGR